MVTSNVIKINKGESERNACRAREPKPASITRRGARQTLTWLCAALAQPSNATGASMTQSSRAAFASSRCTEKVCNNQIKINSNKIRKKIEKKNIKMQAKSEPCHREDSSTKHCRCSRLIYSRLSKKIE